MSRIGVNVSMVAIDERGRVLLTRSMNGEWSLPGGSFMGGDDWRQTLIRQVKSTAHITPLRSELFGIYSEPRLCASFVVREFEGTPDPGSNEWFAVEGLPSSMAGPIRNQIMDALAFKGKVFVR